LTSAHRRLYIDWARGIAVLLMIEAHTTDAWTRVAARSSTAFRNATILGGFAAPLFLWLAGLAVVLSATRSAERTGSRVPAVDAICRRGLEIFVLAFLFRLQAFLVSPGSHPVTIFRVDILNIMGPSMVAAGVVWGLSTTAAARAISLGVLAAAIALVTPIVRTARWLDPVATWVQWYIRPAGEHTTFTAFPWAGFVFAGGAVGAVIARAGDAESERRRHLLVAAAGAALVGLGFFTAARPSIYRESSFWTSSPTWFAIRVGIVMIAVGIIYALAAGAERANLTLRPLARMGRSSLFVYWIHVELVYGYASWLWRGRLPLWGTAIAYVIFSALMYGALLLRDRILATRQKPRAPAAGDVEPEALTTRRAHA
jgi:uncharacterized membrane protein